MAAARGSEEQASAKRAQDEIFQTRQREHEKCVREVAGWLSQLPQAFRIVGAKAEPMLKALKARDFDGGVFHQMMLRRQANALGNGWCLHDVFITETGALYLVQMVHQQYGLPSLISAFRRITPEEAVTVFFKLEPDDSWGHRFQRTSDGRVCLVWVTQARDCPAKLRSEDAEKTLQGWINRTT